MKNKNGTQTTLLTQDDKEYLDFKTILETDNIAEILSEEMRSSIASKIDTRYKIDLQSRTEKQKQLQDIIRFTLSQSEKRSFPFEGSSNVIFPLISTACVEFAAKCYPEIFKDGNIVKAKVIGNDDGEVMKDLEGNEMRNEDGSVATLDETGLPAIQNVGAKLKRGQRVATVMNYQLNEEIEGFEQDMDALFNALSSLGTMFKKNYYDSNENKICSSLIYPDKLIINDFAPSFEAPVTQIIEKYPQDVVSSIRSGDYIDFDFDPDAVDSATDTNGLDKNNEKRTSDESQAGLILFLEQHTRIDLDNDGYAEPYIAVIHKATNKLVKLIKRFHEKDVKKNKKGEIESIKAINFFVRYIFIPSPDGSFYGIGLGHLLFNINSAINSSINQLTDAGTLQNTGGGFISKSLNITGGMKSFRPAEWKMVDSFGSNIRDAIVSLPVPEPSQTLFVLMQFLVNAGKELGSLRDVLTGENAGNIAATTYMGMAEQGQKQFKSVFMRIYNSLRQEIRIFYELNSEYLSQKKYSEILDIKLFESPSVKEDFSLKGYDIVPVANPENVISMQKFAKAQFLMGFIGSPMVDQFLLHKTVFETAGIENFDKFIIQPQPQPDPVMEVAMAQEETKRLKIQGDMQNEANKFQLDQVKLQKESAKLDSEVLVNYAQAGKLVKDTEMAETKEQLDVLDNIIDAQTRKDEMQDRKEDRQLKAVISLAGFEKKNQQVQLPSTKEIIEENATSADI
jgi:chaperonin GroES